ncbi:MAG: hypothetical protein J0J04_08185 [Microbacterium sp.]|uniref:hypothetical protein n=1 Tax=Microbacterium sp. TaxID=51671 RepID=UPI001AC8DC72|nr:hypothetical protein [Microbacterium sp.]MBN9214779.1 hypothetical protein [Microbacterium sp.]
MTRTELRDAISAYRRRALIPTYLSDVLVGIEGKIQPETTRADAQSLAAGFVGMVAVARVERWGDLAIFPRSIRIVDGSPA